MSSSTNCSNASLNPEVSPEAMASWSASIEGLRSRRVHF
jgi:hypothetical protein